MLQRVVVEEELLHFLVDGYIYIVVKESKGTLFIAQFHWRLNTQHIQQLTAHMKLVSI